MVTVRSGPLWMAAAPAMMGDPAGVTPDMSIVEVRPLDPAKSIRTKTITGAQAKRRMLNLLVEQK
jgi:hypothetical protein